MLERVERHAHHEVVAKQSKRKCLVKMRTLIFVSRLRGPYGPP